MQTAFVLGAGLGTRLRPLTEHIPKPLVPFAGRPLITYAFDHLISVGIRRFFVNTHHCPGAYTVAFPDRSYREIPIEFVHEPELLETGGGIANIRHLLPPGEGLVVYNGDILTDLPLLPALELHRSQACAATLVVRHDHPDKRISLDESSGNIVDIRGELGTGHPRNFGFTGIYFLSAGFLDSLPPVAKYSVVPVFLDQIRDGIPIRGVPADSGTWADLGDRDAYLAAHESRLTAPLVDPTAAVAPTATVSGASVVGPRTTVGPGAVVADSILWDGSEVAADSNLERCIVRSRQIASGTAMNQDF